MLYFLSELRRHTCQMASTLDELNHLSVYSFSENFNLNNTHRVPPFDLHCISMNIHCGSNVTQSSLLYKFEF